MISLELCLHQRRDSWRQECNSKSQQDSKIVTASLHRVAINLKRKPSAGVPCNTSQHIAAEVEQHLQTCVVACNLQDNEREGSETSVRGGTAAGHLVMRTLKPSQHVQ